MNVVSVCRSGCRTKDHSSWGECARAADIGVAPGETSNGRYTSKSWDAELNAYRAARAEGIQPASTKMKDIETAVKVSDAHGAAFDATTGSFKE